MRLITAIVAGLVLIGCASDGASKSGARSAPDSSMQAIVNRVAATHRDVARLSIHTYQGGSSHMAIAASTVPGRIGEMSDPEDLDAARTGRAVVMREGHNLDYTESVMDASNRTIAVIGVTVSGASGATDDALLQRAKSIAAETADAIRSTTGR